MLRGSAHIGNWMHKLKPCGDHGRGMSCLDEHWVEDYCVLAHWMFLWAVGEARCKSCSTSLKRISLCLARLSEQDEVVNQYNSSENRPPLCQSGFNVPNILARHSESKEFVHRFLTTLIDSLNLAWLSLTEHSDLNVIPAVTAGNSNSSVCILII